MSWARQLREGGTIGLSPAHERVGESLTRLILYLEDGLDVEVLLTQEELAALAEAALAGVEPEVP